MLGSVKTACNYLLRKVVAMARCQPLCRGDGKIYGYMLDTASTAKQLRGEPRLQEV